MKKILIDYADRFVRTALIEDGTLTEIIVDDKNNASIVGNIYAGVVKSILPSRFAFVDIGAEKNAFLNLNDGKESEYAASVKIGQSILVQVINDATGTKGSHVTMQLHLTCSLVVVFRNGRGMVGISHKIRNKTRREQLRKLALSVLPPDFGAVIRTASADKSDGQLREAVEGLLTQHRNIVDRGQYSRAPALIYREDTILRELIAEDLQEIIINDQTELTAVKTIAERYIGGSGDKVSLYMDVVPLFDAYGIEKEITRALDTKVWLKSGGFLVIEHTEACVVIDVNTGKYIGHTDHRETVLRINLEAADEIGRQIRLRNLSGIIIIDFIDLGYQEDQKTLYDHLSLILQKDRLKTNIADMTKLGLLLLTRKKTREPLLRVLTSGCESCQRRGYHLRTDYNAVIHKGNKKENKKA